MRRARLVFWLLFAALVLQGNAKARLPADHGHPTPHESEGLVLSAESGESVGAGGGCPADARVRKYRVAAIKVDVTLNHYLDHDPEGRMYVLENRLEAVRSEERRNRLAREEEGRPALSLGLGRDAIQPLTLRVNQGECVRIAFTNRLKGEPAGIHLHESTMRVRGGGAAVAANTDATAEPGGTVEYEWMAALDEPEGTHYFHSHGNYREQTSHGLFGAVIVEPRGSKWLDPSGAGEASTGWVAMISGPGSDFREYVLYYHEIGDETYRLLDRNDEFVPIVDPLTKAYRPGARALNYRSEPFLNRLKLQKKIMGRFDESVAYSSYSFGDPSTPIFRAYLGDPVKQRVVHGGSEVFHVHHVHGGSIRWRRQPDAEDTRFDAGLDKHPPLLPRVSERIDSQSIGPSETYDVENECGAGGCQASAGDFLIHCHVAHHYFAGMWNLWRVYNTLQDGESSTDSLPALAELPDRRRRVLPAVDSAALEITKAGARLRAQLPPPGVHRGYDASVFDWSKPGKVYLGEPETAAVWPAYRSDTPGKRPRILFDPATGKLAYPFLRPHLGRRPPFPPAHNPAPFLDPVSSVRDPPAPGASGPGSLCPRNTTVRRFLIQAVALPVTLNEAEDLTDPGGELFVLKEQEESVRSRNALRVPLAIRANAGEHCVDLVLRSELEDNVENHGFAKVNAHIHLLQFDVQASDGVIAGFNYEQSVRPFKKEGERLAAPSAPGASSIAVLSAARFRPGAAVGVGMDQDETFEVRAVAGTRGNILVLDEPLDHPHDAGEYVSTEFVRYRWYPDVQFGTAYFHDHVNAISSWKHGLFGALVSEPPGSTYHHPATGAEVSSGPVADVHTDRRVSADVTGSFRELVLFIQDGNPITHVGRSTGGSYNLRVEPLEARARGDAARAFSSRLHGDPETPVLEARLGDPVVFRTLVAGTNEVHTFHLDGHWFRAEPFSRTSAPVSTVHVGISERYDLYVPAAGGPQRRPGDYLFHSGSKVKVVEGAWGLLRVLPASGPGPRPLPDRRPVAARTGGPCPRAAPVRAFRLEAIEKRIEALRGKKVRVLIEKGSPGRATVPLVMRISSGDCLAVALANRTESPVALHADLLVYDPENAGTPAGRSRGRVVAPGGTGDYLFYAHPELGEATALLRDRSDSVSQGVEAPFGAVAVAAKGSRFRVEGGPPVPAAAAWYAQVIPGSGQPYRDAAIFLTDEDPVIGTHRMPYSRKASGRVSINYGAAGAGPGLELAAETTDRLRLRVLSPHSQQVQVFSVEGSHWPLEPGLAGSDRLSSVAVGGEEAVRLDLEPFGGGGRFRLGNHRGPHFEAGAWGEIVVGVPGKSEKPGSFPLVPAAVAGLLALGILGWLALKGRRGRERKA